MSGRKLLIILSLGCLSAFYLALLFWGEKAVWGALDIPTHHPSFIDLRGVLTGLDAARLGFDPIYQNPLDPYQRPVVYPRLWLTLGWVGLTEQYTDVLAYGLIAAYAISLIISIKGYSPLTAFWLVSVIFSPAAMMCYKFGNVDLVIFILLALMLSFERFSFVWVFGLIELAAFLKFYPIVALGYLLKEERKRFFRFALVGCLIFVAYLTLTWQDTSWILGNAPKGALENFGVGVVSFRIYEITNSRTVTSLVALPFFLLVYILIILALYLSSLYKGNLSEDNNRFIDAFRIGVLIYLATFIQGNSFNYRFIFMIFSVPQIVLWAQAQTDLRFAAYWTLALLVASCWGMLLTQYLPINHAFALDEIANWTLFVGSLYLFLVSSPDWIRFEIITFFKKYHKSGTSHQRIHH